MSRSTFGNRFTVTTWGESHGKAIGAVVDGCPAGLPLHSFAATYVRLSPEILLFPGFQAFFISIFSHILLDIYGCICYNSHSGGAYYAFKENKNQYRTYLSCDC